MNRTLVLLLLSPGALVMGCAEDPGDPLVTPSDLKVVTASLPSGQVGRPYRAELVGQGGYGAGYQWSVVGALPAGVVLQAPGASDTDPTAQILGTPFQSGSFEVALQLTDGAGSSASAEVVLRIAPSPPLLIVTRSLPEGGLGAPYEAQLEAEGGLPPYSWALIAGAPPPGVALSERGALSGAPVAWGRFEFSVRVFDLLGAVAEAQLSLTVVDLTPPLTVVTAQLPDGVEAAPYAAQLSADGGEPPYTWSLLADAPPGLGLEPEGNLVTLTGTPTEAGRFMVMVRVSDAANRIEEATYTLDVRPEVLPVRIVTSSVGPYVLPPTRLRESYELAISAEHGTGAYRWAVSAGRLPAGLSVEASGTPSTRLVGVASERGTFDFTITVADDNTTTDSQPFRLFVDEPLNALNVVTATLSSALLCHEYSAEIVARAGSNSGYQWSITAGTLPSGLALDPQGTPSTRLHGRPVTGSAGTYPITLTVTDSNGDTAQQALTLTVIDDGTADRWVVIHGDVIVDGRFEILVSDVCPATPTPALPVSPAGTIGAPLISAYAFDMSPDGTKVAFIGDFRVPGMDEVWVTDLTQPPPYTAVIVSPSTSNPSTADAIAVEWSPTGDRLVFLGDFNTNGVNELYAVDTGGLVVPNSATPIAPLPPAFADVDLLDYLFSPDGRYVAYAHDTAGESQYELWVFDLMVGTPRSARKVTPTLPGPNSDVAFPVVWADNTRLLYGCACEVALRQELFIADISGATIVPRVISDPAISGQLHISSSPQGPLSFGVTRDGRWAWYLGNSQSSTQGITLYRVDLSNPTALGEPVFTPLPVGQSVLAVRPSSGGRLVTMGTMDVPGLRELFMVDLGLAVPQSVPASKVSGAQPSSQGIQATNAFEVSPNGRYVAFSIDMVVPGHHAGFLVDLDNLAAGPVQLTPNVTNPNLDIIELYWSPTSDWVALYGDLRNDTVYELFASNVGAGAPYPFVQLGPPLAGVQDISARPIWRADGAGIFLKGDLQTPAQDDAWWVSVDDPATAVPLTHAPMNGGVYGIKGQGR